MEIPMPRTEKRGIAWTQMLALEQAGLGRREPVSDQRDKFILNPAHRAASLLTTRPEADGFVRADKQTLLFRNASASLCAAMPAGLRSKRMTSEKGLEFTWRALENADIRALFTVIRAHAGVP